MEAWQPWEWAGQSSDLRECKWQKAAALVSCVMAFFYRPGSTVGQAITGFDTPWPTSSKREQVEALNHQKPGDHSCLAKQEGSQGVWPAWSGRDISVITASLGIRQTGRESRRVLLNIYKTNIQTNKNQEWNSSTVSLVTPIKKNKTLPSSSSDPYSDPESTARGGSWVFRRKTFHNHSKWGLSQFCYEFPTTIYSVEKG